MDDTDWLGAARRATEAVQDLLVGAGDRSRVTGGVGEGGDRTLVIDQEAEDAVFGELEKLHEAGARFTAVSEERGEVDFGSRDTLIVIDPIDGSTNAKRGLPHHSLSIAVADGPTMGDVSFAYVYDFGPAEEWTATRGEGAWLDGVRLDRDATEQRSEDGRLELLGIESSDPRLLMAAGPELAGAAHRLRALGTIAVTLCQVAAARLDAMVTLRPTRAVDAAAGQLIVREGGGAVAFTAYDDPLGAPLDIPAHSQLVAARTPDGVERLRFLADQG
jgi:myo-inositol-1(or 4)-monophosphatase